MPAPEPMLSSRGVDWPSGAGWVMQTKWDGFRLLLEMPRSGTARAWSRHGASLGERVPVILEPFREMQAGTIVDGELVAIGTSDGGPAQDFASVRRAVFNGDPEAIRGLRFVAFDLLMIDGDDLRSRPWSERDQELRRSLPLCDRVRMVESQPASRERHDAIVSLGFEGTVLKRVRSTYRAGRQSAWVKHKARRIVTGTAVEVREDRNGMRWVFCDVDGRRVVAGAAGAGADVVGRRVRIVYSRVDADGSLREARIDQRQGAGSDRGIVGVAAGRE
jgi:ATP-dependent DNA ligase